MVEKDFAVVDVEAKELSRQTKDAIIKIGDRVEGM